MDRLGCFQNEKRRFLEKDDRAAGSGLLGFLFPARSVRQSLMTRGVKTHDLG